MNAIFHGLPRGARVPRDDDPDIPQPQGFRDEPKKKKPGRRAFWLTLLAGIMIGGAGTDQGWRYYAENKLYTHPEVLELLNGLANVVATRAYNLGKQECRRQDI